MSRELVLAAGLVLGGLGYLALAWYVWHYRAAAGGRGLLAVLLSVFLWTSAYAVELSCRTVDGAEAWAVVRFVGVVAMPPSLLAFALEYTGRRALGRRAVALLAVLPTLTITSMIVPATDTLIHAYDRVERAAGVLDHPPLAVAGPLFWPHAIYNYVMVLVALALVVVRLSRLGRPYRRQAVVVTVAALVPLGANIAYNAGLFGPDAMDPLPFLFTLLTVVLVWGFFRVRLLDLVPVARDTVLEQMTDGVIVLDVYDRVVDSNPAAAGLLGVPEPDLIGRYVVDLLPPLASVLAQLEVGGAPVRGDVRLGPGLGPAGGGRDVAVTLTTLVSGTAPAGRLLLLHDVTERQEAQRRLHELLAEQTRVADTLQAGLRPASLPRVDGVEMAARALPSGAGDRVSGDFYDVHRVLGGDWAFVLGDVSGKGVEAAVLTSLARYTVRTLSAEGRSPVQVLEQLNRALLDDTSERFCTLVYGRIDAADLLKNTALLDTDVADHDLAGLHPAGEGYATLGAAVPERSAPTSVHLTLTLGGHPRPLVRRRDGSVHAVGEPGTALGLLGRTEIHEVPLDLESGDVLLAYTDGVTEARRGTEQFGEERHADVLSASATALLGHTGLAVAHLVAEAVAERVLTAVTDWAWLRDDAAVLVIAVP